MKAYCLPGPGQNLELMEIPVPVVFPNEVLVRMRAFGVGLHDRNTIPGGVTFPYPNGVEGAGIVATIGSAVSTYQTGDRVMFCGLHPKGGTWAEYAAIDAQMLMPMPDGLDSPEAAALPVAGITALRGASALQLTKGDSAFIAGASGAIGTIKIQLAVRRGYRIAASSSPQNHAYMQSPGADLALDYRDPNWA